MVLILFVQVLKSLEFELKNPAETLFTKETQCNLALMKLWITLLLTDGQKYQYLSSVIFLN